MKFFLSPIKVVLWFTFVFFLLLFSGIMLAILVQNTIVDTCFVPLGSIFIFSFSVILIFMLSLCVRLVRVFIVLLKGQPLIEITNSELIEHVDFKIRIPLNNIKKIKLVDGSYNCVLKILYKGGIKRRNSLQSIFLKKNEIGLMFFFFKGKQITLMEKIADEIQRLNPSIRRY